MHGFVNYVVLLIHEVSVTFVVPLNCVIPGINDVLMTYVVSVNCVALGTYEFSVWFC